ncbi:MAG: GntR family transcriptional regulator [Erysipelotrichaceae bacterium]|nr:GntR family transcriptional regulator [Erysipelotrichaceae bacterium]
MLINLRGKEPIFLQVKNQIINYIKLGILKADDKLPSVRNLAEELGINLNTVQKVYSELESEGYVYTLNKKGVFVDKNNDCQDYRQDEAKKLIDKIKKSGISKTQLLEILEEVYK